MAGTEQARVRQVRTGQGKVREGSVGYGRTGQGRVRQSKAGPGRAGLSEKQSSNCTQLLNEQSVKLQASLS